MYSLKICHRINTIIMSYVHPLGSQAFRVPELRKQARVCAQQLRPAGRGINTANNAPRKQFLSHLLCMEALHCKRFRVSQYSPPVVLARYQ